MSTGAQPPAAGAEVRPPAPAAPPFASYSSADMVHVPAADWGRLYASLQALKGHVQEYPGCQRFDVFVSSEADGDVILHCYTTWDSAVELEAFLERGYSVARLMSELGIDVSRSLVMEKLF
jgi:rhodanese-related sulfurtransferase